MLRGHRRRSVNKNEHDQLQSLPPQPIRHSLRTLRFVLFPFGQIVFHLMTKGHILAAYCAFNSV